LELSWLLKYSEQKAAPAS